MLLHHVAWYCMFHSCIDSIVILSDWCDIGVVWSENLKKVTLLAFWIYTGTQWCKKLLSELTEAQLGIWVLYIYIELN